MTSRTGRAAPIGLVALAAIPLLAGVSRLMELAGGPQLIPADPRFTASPVPVVLHISASAGFALLGAFQFSAGIRRRHPTWHRRAGRVVLILGLVVALSGLGMTLAFAPKEGTGAILQAARLLASSGMAACLVLGFAAIRRRDVRRHSAWMIRAYALGLGAGTQAFTVGVGEAALGSGVVRHDLFMAAGWAVNLAIAEWIIRRPVAGRTGGSPARGPRADGAPAGSPDAYSPTLAGPTPTAVGPGQVVGIAELP